MQRTPFYAIKDSPINESPLGLFDPVEDGAILEEDYGIDGEENFSEPVSFNRLRYGSCWLNINFIC